ncbi:hypothetical protein GCM10027299_09780 [Larkinella ripae]
MSFALQCRVWDTQNRQMHYLSSQMTRTNTFQTILLEDVLALVNLANPADIRLYETTEPWRLMLSVGQQDREGTLLFDYDIVECDGHHWIIQNHPERCGYSLFMLNSLGLPPYLRLDRELAQLVKQVGNFFEHTHLMLDLPAVPLRWAA